MIVHSIRSIAMTPFQNVIIPLMVHNAFEFCEKITLGKQVMK